MIAGLKAFLTKPAAEKARIVGTALRMMDAVPFLFGKSDLSFTALAYKPDSITFFDAHPEYRELRRRFVAHNRFNNAGDLVRLWLFVLNIKQVLEEGIAGDFAEVGVWRGNTAAVLAHYAALEGRALYLFDTFEGFDRRDLDGIDRDKKMAFANTSVDLVRQVVGPASASCRFVKGYFPSTVTAEHETRTYAVVSLDCDLYEPMKAGLAFFYPRMPKGGLLLLHDYSSHFWAGAKQAIDEFCAAEDERVILMPDKSGSAVVRKSR